VRTLLWVVAIAALAVGLTLAASHNTGYVLLALPPYRVELSLNLLLVLLALGFATGYALVRAVSAMLGLPRQVREYRVARRREKARATLLEALHEYRHLLALRLWTTDAAFVHELPLEFDAGTELDYAIGGDLEKCRGACGIARHEGK